MSFLEWRDGFPLITIAIVPPPIVTPVEPGDCVVAESIGKLWRDSYKVNTQ